MKKQNEVKSVLRKVLPTLIAVALSGAALAQTEGYTGHSTGLTGGTNIGNGLEGTSVVNSLFGGAYWSMDGFDWGLQGRVNLSNLNPANLNSGSIFGGQANLLARVPLGDSFRLFGGPGLQVQREATAQEAKIAFGPNLLTGLEFRLSENAGLILEGNTAYMFNPNPSFTNWRFGLAIGMVHHF